MAGMAGAAAAWTGAKRHSLSCDCFMIDALSVRATLRANFRNATTPSGVSIGTSPTSTYHYVATYISSSSTAVVAVVAWETGGQRQSDMVHITHVYQRCMPTCQKQQTGPSGVEGGDQGQGAGSVLHNVHMHIQHTNENERVCT